MFTKDNLELWVIEIKHVMELRGLGCITDDETTSLLNQIRKEMGLSKLDKFDLPLTYANLERVKSLGNNH